MTLQRSDRLKEPPVVGCYYLVPAILWNRHAPWPKSGMSQEKILANLQQTQGAKWWPVWGNKHNDIEHFNFHPLHYHIDPRFLTKSQIRESDDYGSRTPLQNIQAQPLSSTDLNSGPPKPVLRRMRCSLAHAEWAHADATAVTEMNTAFAGRQCAKGKRGFVCPHKLFPLGSVEAINGVVTCPLHGLRIDATGKCLGSMAVNAA